VESYAWGNQEDLKANCPVATFMNRWAVLSDMNLYCTVVGWWGEWVSSGLRLLGRHGIGGKKGLVEDPDAIVSKSKGRAVQTMLMMEHCPGLWIDHAFGT
jgi:hypothetical protein